MVVEVGDRPVGRQRASRQAVAMEEVLRDADGFRTALEIYEEIRRRGDAGSLTTVYRYVNLLAETGRADVVYRGDGEARYRLCGQQQRHHHHLVCRNCGHTVEIEGRGVERWAAQMADEHGFTAVDHTVELIGLCADCRP